MVFILLFFIDRLLKIFAFAYPEFNFVVLDHFFQFSFASNYEMSFSLAFPYKLFLVFYFTAFAVLGYCLWRDNNAPRKKLNLGLILILVGALSNFIDRFSLGYVIDYLAVLGFSFFNLADLAILGGVSILIVKSISKKRFPGLI